jgi:hypothetical protein
MKKNKYKNVKIIGNKANNENYTFIDVEKNVFHQSSLPPKKNENNGQEQNTINKFEGKIKMKKVMDKEETLKSSKGLKFTNKSQRNHSSVYE